MQANVIPSIPLLLIAAYHISVITCLATKALPTTHPDHRLPRPLDAHSMEALLGNPRGTKTCALHNVSPPLRIIIGQEITK